MIDRSIPRKKFLTPRGEIEIDGQCSFSVFLDGSRFKESVQIRKTGFGASRSSCDSGKKIDRGDNKRELALEIASAKKISKHDNSICHGLVWLQQGGDGDRYSIWQSFCDESSSELLEATNAKQTFKALRPTMLGLWILCISIFGYYLWHIYLWNSDTYLDGSLPCLLRFFLVPLLVCAQFRRYKQLIMMQYKKYEKAMNKLQFIAMRKNIEQDEVVFSVSCNQRNYEWSAEDRWFIKLLRSKKYKIDVFEPRMMKATHPDYHLYHSDSRIQDCKLRVGMEKHHSGAPRSTIVFKGRKEANLKMKTVHSAVDEDEVSTTSSETSTDEEKGGESSCDSGGAGDSIDHIAFYDEDEESSSLEKRKVYEKRYDPISRRREIYSKPSVIKNWPYIYH